MTSSRIDRLWSKQVDIASLVYFRIAFGLLLAAGIIVDLRSGTVTANYIQPTVHFTYPGFSWVPALPGSLAYPLHWALLACAICVTVGFAYRYAMGLFFILFTYRFLLDESLYLNHYYLVILLALLMTMAPAGHAGSIDARLKPEKKRDTVPGVFLWLILAQVCLVYFFAGIAKINIDWWYGEPVRTWLQPKEHVWLLGSFTDKEWFVLLISRGGLLFDLLAAPLLIWRRTRWFGLIWAFLFHFSNYLLFNIGVFPWMMIAVTALFLHPKIHRSALSTVGLLNAQPNGPTLLPMPETKPRMVLTAFIACYLLLQVLFPLRHFAYPGNVHWTEEGHQFSWHMLLRSKSGDIAFHITETDTGGTRVVDPREHLTPRQAHKMSGHPDMIIQFAHFLRDIYPTERRANIEIRGVGTARLNGRPTQAIIDPKADLAQIERDWKTNPHIEPLRDWAPPTRWRRPKPRPPR